MAYYRSLLSLILVIVATFLVSCGSPTVATAPQTYTSAQIEQIQQYVPEIVALRDRMKEIPVSIQKSDWIGVNSFIHGPLGELRMKMIYVTRNLFPKDREATSQTTKDLFSHLVKIEQAAQESNSQAAKLNYQAALADINKFLQLVPQATTEPSGSET